MGEVFEQQEDAHLDRLHDLASEPSIGEVQSPPAASLRASVDRHHCHAAGCKTACKPEHLMCGKHWGMVSKELQEAVWDAYRPGQCDDKRPSEAWFRAADAAIAHVAQKEGRRKKADIPIITLSEVPAHVGDEVYIKFAVASAELSTTKHGKSFAKLDLVDQTGRVEGRMWDTSTLPCNAGDVVGVKAKADEFNGQPQIIILSVKPLPDEDASQFLPASHLSADFLEGELDNTLNEMRDGEIKDVVVSIFGDDEVRALFFAAPASQRNHHAYERGLAEHTLSMVHVARSLSFHYQQFYGDDLDHDLVLAGVLLHDLGKVFELARNGLAWEFTIEGELVGHITSCATLIHDACMATAASDETRRRLLHVVEAHHGRNDWGSPVEPRMWEAQLVHLVDMIDSRSGMFREARKGLEPGERSEWIRPLGGRVVR